MSLLISWYNKNRGFDVSTGEFKTPDLFTLLENIYEFDYKSSKLYDDIYYILTYIEKSATVLFDNLNSNIKRKNELTHISRAKSFDQNSVLWLSRQEGRTINEKVKNNKIKALQKYYDYDTYENRLFKLLLKKLLLITEKRNDLNEFEKFIFKIRRFLKSDIAKSINENGYIIYNNLLLHHKHYYKIYKSYKWLNSLDEKKLFFENNKRNIKNQIFRFELLSKIQYDTFAKVLASDIDWEKFWEIKLNPFLLNKTVDHLYFKSRFSDIRDYAFEFIQNRMHLSITHRFFKIEPKEKEVFVDLFRLFPIAKNGEENITFPIFVKQEDSKIINANNTKVIDLNREFYTLPEILKTYDLQILRIFLDDFKKYFKNAKINYLLPDYIEPFKFAKAKKLINSYFHGRNIPKSVLAGFNYIFKNRVERNDILIYIQKNHENELFVTPLLIDFDNRLLHITNGLMIRRYPTKKVKKSRDIINYLNRLFDQNTAQKILNKCLQNGIKALNKTKTALLYNDRLIYFNHLNFINPASVSEEEVKSLYDHAIFENKNYKEISDDKFENLKVFEKIIQYEKEGYTLWREYIPKLSLEVVNEYGAFEEFVLIDENTNQQDEITVQKRFIIPAHQKEISLPLIFEGVNIDYEAYITSPEMPFSENVECELKLTYNYELENPFSLTFYPLKKYKPLKVKWREKENISSLPYPAYPPKKRWQDFLNDNGSNLPVWVLEKLQMLDNMEEEIQKETDNILQNIKESYVTSRVLQGKDGSHYVFAKSLGGRDILCNERNFIEKIDIHTLKQGDTIKFYLPEDVNIAKFIHISDTDRDIIEKTIFNEKSKLIKNAIHSIRPPVLIMWSNMSLSDEFVPEDFKNEINRYTQRVFEFMISKKCHPALRKEFQFFLSAIHEDTHPHFYRYILNLSKQGKLSENMALLLGRMNKKWQKQLFYNIINQLPNPYVLTLLGIAVWRDEHFINYLEKYTDKILPLLFENIFHSFEELKSDPSSTNKKLLSNNLELLLALLRLRRKDPKFLHPNEKQTKEFIKLISQIGEYLVKNNIEIFSKIELSLSNETNKKIPKLLYALNIYLRGDLNMAQSIKITGVNK